jgi:cob(I)alamin adenosyltransferase
MASASLLQPAADAFGVFGPAAGRHGGRDGKGHPSMVVLNRIYTRSGDDGTTALGTGERRKKYDLRIEAYGTLDELNAVIGLVRLATAGAPIDAALGRIQNDLFDVEADLCMPDKGKGPGGQRLAVTDVQVTWLEQEIDRLNADLPPLRSFILPGGTEASAYLHLARTVCRRGERLMAKLNDKPGESVTPAALKYINRLSDYLFVASRSQNDHGVRDILWVPGENR